MSLLPWYSTVNTQGNTKFKCGCGSSDEQGISILELIIIARIMATTGKIYNLVLQCLKKIIPNEPSYS